MKKCFICRNPNTTGGKVNISILANSITQTQEIWLCPDCLYKIKKPQKALDKILLISTQRKEKLESNFTCNGCKKQIPENQNTRNLEISWEELNYHTGDINKCRKKVTLCASCASKVKLINQTINVNGIHYMNAIKTAIGLDIPTLNNIWAVKIL